MSSPSTVGIRYRIMLCAAILLGFVMLTAGLIPAQTAEPDKAEATEERGDDSGPRTWTSRSGQTLEAEFVKLQSGILHLKRADGTTLRIPLRNLSEEDIAVAKQLAQGEKDEDDKGSASSSLSRMSARGSKASGLLSEEEIEALVTEWTDEDKGKGYELEVSMGQVTKLSAKDKKKYAKSGEVPFIMYASLYEFKIANGAKKYTGRADGSCKIYILDSENTVVIKKSMSLDKLCAT